jgi:hypothetical protein
MAEKFQEYHGRSHKKIHHKKGKNPYIKKLLLQSVFSLLILSLIASLKYFNSDFSTKAKAITKSAFSYDLNKTDLSRLIEKYFSIKGELTNEEITETLESKNL